ncbi:unnamed protein product [Trichobilharzia szidati]|nr:unnamed protein product [Trichobilharzia szidati]
MLLHKNMFTRITKAEGDAYTALKRPLHLDTVHVCKATEVLLGTFSFCKVTSVKEQYIFRRSTYNKL